MTCRGSRGGCILRALGVGLLAAALIVILGWAVIGKHRFDPDARLVYKATRVVVSHRIPVPSPVIQPLKAFAVPPPPALYALEPVAARCRAEAPARGERIRSSRAPPSA